MSDELTPCPFRSINDHFANEPKAHHLRVLPMSTWHDDDDRYCVYCQLCTTHGPIGKTESDAIAAWNRRSDIYALGEAMNKLQALDTRTQTAAIGHLCNRATRKYPGPAILNATAADINASIKTTKDTT